MPSLITKASTPSTKYLLTLVLSAFINCYPGEPYMEQPECRMRKETQYNYALIKAYEKNEITCFRRLLQHGANPNIRINRSKFPLLNQIIKDQKQDFFYALLEAEPNYNIECEEQSTPIQMAMADNLKGYFLTLLEKRPRLLVTNHCEKGDFLLLAYYIYNNPDLYERLEELAHCEFITHEELELFFEAIKGDDLDAVKLYLDASPYLLGGHNNWGETPFTWAIKCRAMSVVQYFIDYDLISNKKNLLGEFPAYIALQRSESDIYQILIERNNQTHMLTDLSESLLHLAVQHKNQAEIIRLIKLKVETETVNFEGFQAFDYLDLELRTTLGRHIALPPPGTPENFRKKTYPYKFTPRQKPETQE